MGRNARKRISYVLPLADSAGGHRLGVNGLAVDPANSILYSGGRDGVLCTWDLNLDLTPRPGPDSDPFADSNAPSYKPPPTRFRQQVQAHTHWINDIALAQGNDALVSASSDITVKVWRPAALDPLPPQTIGLHTDYVKRVASPGLHENWVASGGLDHKISLWDLNGAGKKLDIAVGEDENSAKGSVYALAATPSIIAGGGPESIVRIWDSRTGKRVTKFVGHTDNIRDVLVAQDGDTILTASSDQTVKVWSMTAGRCMYTLTMHNDSVWSLFSDDPRLSVFYSADRSGIVAKTDVRNCSEMDEGMSVAVCQEHEGVNKVIRAGDYLWTATSSSSINRWNDVDTAADVALPESYRWHRASIGTTRSRYPSPPTTSPPMQGATPKIPFKALLRLSNTSPFPQPSIRDPEASTLYSVASSHARRPSEALTIADPGVAVPVRDLPDFTIEGQNGLIKHHLLNDRRRVLTLDTAGEVMLWDLLKCVPIKSFGKRHLEDVVPEVNTRESVAHWCAVDTRTGSLTCVLEENYCFDAEMYADEIEAEEEIKFRDDQRINLGKWVLRYLFANLIDEEIKRDEDFRKALLSSKNNASNRPMNIQIPPMTLNGWDGVESGPLSNTTIRPTNGLTYPNTPGLAIGLATPGVPPSSAGNGSQRNLRTPATEDGSQLERTQTGQSQNNGDYFSSMPTSNGSSKGPASTENTSDTAPDNAPLSPTTEETTAKKGKALFSKKFNMTFNMKKFGSAATPTETPKPPTVDEKSEDSDSKSNKTDEAKTFTDNFWGGVQKIRHGYEEQVAAGATTLTSHITPSLPNDTPILRPPDATTILIQEDRPDSGSVADLFEGKVGTVGLPKQVDLIEKAAPMWLADVLLKNQIPLKDVVKISFVLEPFQNSLPSISADGYIPLLPPADKVVPVANPLSSNNRLNANRMLRARKILSYVAERIDPPPPPAPQPPASSKGSDHDGDGAEGQETECKPEAEDDLKPEEYLELWCQGQLIPPTMTLASIRAHIWRGGSDVLLHYKANGRKEIKPRPPQPVLAHDSTVPEGASGGAKVSSEAERSSQQSSRGGGIGEAK